MGNNDAHMPDEARPRMPDEMPDEAKPRMPDEMPDEAGS